MLDITPFEKAISKLKTSLYYANSESVTIDPEMREVLRGGAIHVFEYTYELSVKMITRYLSMTEPVASYPKEMSFSELIRRAYEIGLIESDLEQWKEWRKARGTTSHTYDEDKAQLVYQDLDNFYTEMLYLLHELKARKDQL